MMNALVLATVIILRLTHPTKNAAPGCSESLLPLDDLHLTRVYGTMVGMSASRFIMYQKIVDGREGMADTLRINAPFGHENWMLEIVEVDSVGNESCVTITYWLPTTDVPIDEKSNVRVEWFDLQGRKLNESETHVPGVYFWRQGESRGKKVVLSPTKEITTR